MCYLRSGVKENDNFGGGEAYLALQSITDIEKGGAFGEGHATAFEVFPDHHAAIPNCLTQFFQFLFDTVKALGAWPSGQIDKGLVLIGGHRYGGGGGFH
jgi:hypothetical protein